jgi:tetratricopeptide (TPR) repeat protein
MALSDTETPAPPTPARPLRWAELALGLLLVAVVGGGYWSKSLPAGNVSDQEAAMQAGLDALYTKNDAAGAVRYFRLVLELNPRHYGAHFQLAKALDAAGRAAEARPAWEAMKPMAEAAEDEETLTVVRARLAKPEPKPDARAEVARVAMTEDQIQGALMAAGLDALYAKNDPVSAAAEFRKVLERNATHYGATYQLATALDRANRRAEARPLWEKVAAMAERYKDRKTLDTAHARLAQAS